MLRLIPRVPLAGAILALLFALRCIAQNVTNYDSIPDPYLFLLREPAVVEDLGLNDRQRQQLMKLNEGIDGPLLALRNSSPEEAQTKLSELMSAAKEQSAKILDDEQLRRLEQIMLRVRGIQCVLVPKVADAVELTPTQRQQIQESLQQTASQLDELRKQVQSGESQSRAEQQAMKVRQDGQRDVLGQLTAEQKQGLMKLLGKTFDPSQLGRVSFKAPELRESEWINGPPLRLADLRGQVVVLHFWAFQCINCQRNFPWYRDWQEAFAGRDVTIVGIHTPETSAERSVDSLRREVTKAGFKFPVIADNDNRNWDAWGNSMWPSVYLIDKQGRLRYWWYGELNWQGAGGQDLMRRRIEELLEEADS